MTISNAKKFLKNILLKHEHTPVLLWGSPGVGKSAISQQIADEFGWGFIDIRLPLLTPSDLLGLPYPDKTYTKANWLYPSFFPEPDSKKKILILFDEISNSPMTIQSACYRIILDRSIGEHYSFPSGIKMVAASNRRQDASGVQQFSKALANRFIHFYIDPDLDSWKSWALKNNINEKIIGFLNFKQNMLSQTPKIEQEAYCTPRSWERVSDLLNSGIFDEEVIAGAIGPGAASEFFSYLEVYQKLPDIQKVLQGEKISIPKEPSVLYALVSSVVIKADKKNIKNVFKFCERIPTEFHMLTIKDIARRDENILKSYEKFEDWLNRYDKFFKDDEEK